MNNLIIYSLEGCGYSQMAEGTINERNLNASVIKVTRDKKEEIKGKNNMNTFPQIFFETSGISHKIGGNDNLNEILEIIDNAKGKDIKIFNNMVENVSNRLQSGRKAALQLIEVLH